MNGTAKPFAPGEPLAAIGEPKFTGGKKVEVRHDNPRGLKVVMRQSGEKGV